jgi:uncharacterized protein with NRDE domain
MCVIFISYGFTSGYKLIVIANRDEFLDRATEPAHFWTEHPNILAGRDLVQGGTWFGITKSGKIAMLTNYREVESNDKGKGNRISRGIILLHFLQDERVDAKEYIASLHSQRDQYEGFNCILGTVNELWYYSNRGIEPQPIRLQPGRVYGLSNELLDCNWQKVQTGKRLLESIKPNLYSSQEELIQDLFNILDTKTSISLSQIPETGSFLQLANVIRTKIFLLMRSVAGLPKETEIRLQSIFVPPIPYKGSKFGTRAQTILLVDESNHATFIERAYDMCTKSWSTRKFAVDLTL